MWYVVVLAILKHMAKLAISSTDVQWGPYRDAVFPDQWMNEGGQSSTGQLIDFVMSTHPAYPKLLELSKKTGKNVFVLLGERLEQMRQEQKLPTTSRFASVSGLVYFKLIVAHLTKDLHFYPDLVSSYQY